MSDQYVSENSDRFAVRATADSHFSWLRTWLSVERTMMAWVRTSVSLIGFGFAIVQFFDRLEQMPVASPARYPDAARYMGLALISCGILALIISLWQYRWMHRYLSGGNFAAIAGVTKEEKQKKQTPLVAISIVLLLIGIYAFFAVLLRLV